MPPPCCATVLLLTVTLVSVSEVLPPWVKNPPPDLAVLPSAAESLKLATPALRSAPPDTDAMLPLNSTWVPVRLPAL